MNDKENFMSECEMYSEEEMNVVDEYISNKFGAFENVFHEIFSPDIHVDICIIEPSEENPYYRLVTMGMGAHRMNVPEELSEYELERAELSICLPPDWKINESDEIWYWPIRTLKSIARLPKECNTWLGWGHTIDNGAPYAENTEFSASLLVNALLEENEDCILPDGEKVNFYQLFPIYREEMQYKIQNNAESLLDLFSYIDFNDVFIVTPERENAADYIDPNSELQGCIASNRILVDGCKVGYCYREEPDDAFADSGWRFLAGDEDEEYLDNSKNLGVYKLYDICRHDEEVIEILDAPYGSAFERNEEGGFVPVED